MSQAPGARGRAGLNPLLAANLLLAIIASGFVLGHTRPARAAPRAPSSVNCDVDPNSLGLDPEEQALFDEINAYRASYGLTSLQPSYVLASIAVWKADDMAARHYDSHDDGFRTWDQRFFDCGYDSPGVFMGEDLAGGNAGAAGTLHQWQVSAPHNASLLDPAFAYAGLKRAHAGDGDPYGWYWALELGSAPY